MGPVIFKVHTAHMLLLLVTTQPVFTEGISHLTWSSSGKPLHVDTSLQKVAECAVEDANVELNISWFRNGKALIEGQDVEIETEVTNSTRGLIRVSSVLRIRPQRSDEWNRFSCSVRTPDAASEQASPDITVLVHGSFKSWFTNVGHALGGAVAGALLIIVIATALLSQIILKKCARRNGYCVEDALLIK